MTRNGPRTVEAVYKAMKKLKGMRFTASELITTGLNMCPLMTNRETSTQLLRVEEIGKAKACYTHWRTTYCPNEEY